jgi:small subunit ribosomal protein S2
MSMLKEMFEAGAHFGHQTKFWNPKMKQYIYGIKNNIHIINLDKTVGIFSEVIKAVKQEIKEGGSVLFVGTRSQAKEIIAAEAIRCGMSYVNHRWFGGLLTNLETVQKSIKKLEQKKALLEKVDNGLTKKEMLNLEREVIKLEANFGGIKELKTVPTMVFVVDNGYHKIAIEEANKLTVRGRGVKTIALVDTNNDPRGIDFVIPANDDSTKSIEFFVKKIADTIIEAKAEKLNTLVNDVKKVEFVEDNSSNQAN